MKIVVCGAGVAGLTSALCLHLAGHDVTVLERAPRIEAVGAGIQLGPNACAVLGAIGVLTPLLKSAGIPDALHLCAGHDGRPVFSMPVNQAGGRWRHPYLHVHRTDLIQTLLDRLLDIAPDSLHLNSPIEHVSSSNGSAVAHAARGDRLNADLIIGADGIHSNTRTFVTHEGSATYTGNVAWRAVVATAALGNLAPPPAATVWAGAEQHAVTYQLRNGDLTNLVLVTEQADWQHENWTQPGEREAMLTRFGDWHPCLRGIIAQTQQCYQWALLDRPPLQRWYRDRVVLIGDASHPMLPFMAQGAAMAIEDAWILASLLGKSGKVADGLLRFQRLRLPRTQRVYQTAKRNERLFHLRTPLTQAVTWGGMRVLNATAPKLFPVGLDWLYGYDPVAMYPIKPKTPQAVT